MPGPAHDGGEQHGSGHHCTGEYEPTSPPRPPRASVSLEQPKQRLLVRRLPGWRGGLRRTRQLWTVLGTHSADVISLIMTRRLTSSLTATLATGPMPFEPTTRVGSTPFAVSQPLTASTRRWLSRRL